MKLQSLFLFLILLVAGISKSLAQPYTLDEKIKPIKLELLEDKRKGHKGEKNIVFWSVVDSINYHYITGQDMYQFVDVLVSSIGNESPLIVELVKDTWHDVEKKQHTSSTKDGIVNFKIRAYGTFGLKVKSASGNAVAYIITIIASPEEKSFLGNPFVKIKDSQMKKGGEQKNTWLYIVIGIALLVIVVLARKLFRKGKLIASMLLFCVSLSVLAQDTDASGFVSVEQMEAYMQNFKQEVLSDVERAVNNKKLIDKTLKGLNSHLVTIRKSWNSLDDLYDSYTGLGGCMTNVALPGTPHIPSFCSLPEIEGAEVDSEAEDYSSDCTNCFTNARQAFNETRYTFEKLRTIYKCTKKFSNAAISFGDNTSGIHAVTGMVWQQERAKIQTEIKKLEQAYDKKYVELLKDLRNNMMELNICEARFGVEDWFDRFGYMYYEFIKETYKRKD